MRIQYTSINLTMVKDEESDDRNDFITIFKVGYKESLLTTLFYSFVILMSYFLRLVWLWLLLDSNHDQKWKVLQVL